MVETLQGSFLQILGTRLVILGLPHKKRDKLGLNRHLRFKKKWFYYWQFWYGMIDVDVSCHNFGWGATELYNCWNDCSKQSQIPNIYADSFSQIFLFAHHLGFQMLILQPAVQCIQAEHTTAHNTSCMSHIPSYIPMFGCQGCKSYIFMAVGLRQNRARIHVFMKNIGSIGPRSLNKPKHCISP